MNKNLYLLSYYKLRYKPEQNREVNVCQTIQTSNNIYTNSNDILYSNNTLILFLRDSNVKWDSILKKLVDLNILLLLISNFSILINPYSLISICNEIYIYLYLVSFIITNDILYTLALLQ